MERERPGPPVTRRCVFLDRDGVIVRTDVRDGRPFAVSTLAELDVLPEAHQACADLRAAGWLLIVVTNQPEVARGTQTRAVLDAMHARLVADLHLDGVYVCPHDDSDACHCRKPKAGLLTDAARRHGIDLAASVMVGDRWRDIEAGRRAGCRIVHVDRNWSERAPTGADAVVADLAEAAGWILSEARTAMPR